MALRSQDEEAARRLWNMYFERLVNLVRHKLSSRRHPGIDEEDIALETFETCFRAISEDRYPNITDRSDFWQILVIVANRKFIDAVRRYSVRKRNTGVPDISLEDIEVQSVLAREPTPEFASAFADEVRRLLEGLKMPELDVVRLYLAGHTVSEIAEQVGVAERSVQRRLTSVREKWSQHIDEVDE